MGGMGVYMIKANKETVKELYEIYKVYYKGVDENNFTNSQFDEFMSKSKSLEEKLYNELKVQTSRFKITPDLPYTIHKLAMMSNMDFDEVCKLYKLLGIKVC